MWKVIIADDESIVRKGIRHAIDWGTMNMEVVSEAKDGEIALEQARKFNPNLMLVDINMPFINGLELIEQLNNELENCIIIIITGYDQFSYAQKAVRLNVFDFLLKPVSPDHLLQAVSEAKCKLEKRTEKNRFEIWAKNQLEKNLTQITQNFMIEWVEGYLDKTEIIDQLQFLRIEFGISIGLIIVHPEKQIDEKGVQWESTLLTYAIQNVLEEMLQDWNPKIIFEDRKGNVVIILHVSDKEKWVEFSEQIKNSIQKYLHQLVYVVQSGVEKRFDCIPEIYAELIGKLSKKRNNTPAVKLAKHFMELYYHDSDLSLQQVAKQVNISATYLSKLLKDETGKTFVESVTQIRLNKALQLLNNPSLKVYEIASRVGIKDQHYFSKIFKKTTGMSPLEYRKIKKGWKKVEP